MRIAATSVGRALQMRAQLVSASGMRFCAKRAPARR
jgi:hypothetical protein